MIAGAARNRGLHCPGITPSTIKKRAGTNVIGDDLERIVVQILAVCLTRRRPDQIPEQVDS